MLILYPLSKQRVDEKWGLSIYNQTICPQWPTSLSCVPRNKIYGLMEDIDFARWEEERSRWKTTRMWLYWVGGFLVNKEIHQVKRWWTECDSPGELKRPQWMKGWDRKQVLGYWFERVFVISLLGCWRF